MTDQGDSGPAAAPVAGPHAARRGRRSDRAQLGLLIIAAALAVAACFQRLFAVPGADGTGFRMDGWGRVSPSNTDISLAGPRFGVLLGSCALLLAISAILQLGSWRVLARLAAQAGGFGLVGVTVSMLVYTRSETGIYRAAADHGLGDQPTSGPCLWLLAAGCLCAVTAIVLSAAINREPHHWNEQDDGDLHACGSC